MGRELFKLGILLVLVKGADLGIREFCRRRICTDERREERGERRKEEERETKEGKVIDLNQVRE